MKMTLQPLVLADEFFAGVDPDDREYRPGPPGALKLPLAFFTVNRFCRAVLYGRAGCVTSLFGGFRPGSAAEQRQRLRECGAGLPSSACDRVLSY